MQVPFQPNMPEKRDNDILKHVHRMRMTTPAVLHRMFFAPHISTNAVSQVVCRHVKAGILNRHQLIRTSNYYTLGPRCVRLFGAARSKTMPRGEQVLPVDWATLAYCCMGDVIRKRLLPKELLNDYPWFPQNQLSQPYYHDYKDGCKRLATIRVELCDFPDFIIKKHIRQLHQLRESDQFRELLENDGFMIVTITTTPERRLAIIEEITKNPWYPHSAVFDFPDLLELL